MKTRFTLFSFEVERGGYWFIEIFTVEVGLFQRSLLFLDSEPNFDFLFINNIHWKIEDLISKITPPTNKREE